GTLFDTTQLASLPRWLAKAITRGLSLRPTDRFPSVLALLAALDRRRWQKGVVAATVFATAFAATGITFAAARPAAVEPCPLPRAELASTWSPDRAALVASMFGAESALVT